MADLTILTNNVPRDLLSLWDLTDKERKDFDYVSEDDGHARFFRYRGSVYDAHEFERIPAHHPEEAFHRWAGYQSDSFFSGVVIRWPLMFPEWPEKGLDFERVIVGRYYS